MSVSKSSETPTPPIATPPASPETLPAGMDFAKLANLDGVKDIMEKLNKGDWAGMVGAIMTMYTEFFGTPEEKAEIAKARAQGNLDTLQTDVEKKKVEEEKKEATEGKKDDAEVQLAENPKLGDGSDIVCIGASVAHGMQMAGEWEKKPIFVGKDGASTSWIKEHLKDERARLKDKKKAIIYCAANNLFNDSAEDIVKHFVEMAKICHEAGVPEIIVGSQFPADPRRENLNELIKKNAELRDEIIKAYKRGDFPAGTRVVDITRAFSNEKGEMKDTYVDRTTNDPLHPRSAYGTALEYMMRSDSSRVV